MPIDISLRDLYLSTRDIPRTQGKSNLTVTVAVNGKVLYTFAAGVEQGLKPTFSDQAAAVNVVKNANDLLALNGFSKKVNFNVEAGRASDEVVITIVSEGTGKRLGKVPG